MSARLPEIDPAAAAHGRARLYAPGALLYGWAKRQRRERDFTVWDGAILAVLVALASVAATLPAVGRLGL